MDSTNPPDSQAADAWADMMQGVDAVVDATVTADDAQRHSNPDLIIPAKIGIEDADIIATLDRLGRELSADPRTYAAGPVGEDLVRRLAGLLAAGEFLPGESSQPDLAWAWVRVLFAGFGHALHGQSVDALRASHEFCPFDRDESVADWMKQAQAARLLTGWPLTTCRMPWDAVQRAFGTTAGPVGFPDKWLTVLAICHLAKYGRRSESGSDHLFVFRGCAQDIRLPTADLQTPLASALGRHGTALASLFGLAPTKKKEHHKPTIAMRAALGALTLASFDRLIPMAQCPRDWLQGPHPRLAPCAVTPGLVPVSMQPSGVWHMRMSCQPGKPTEILIDPLPANPALLDYDWSVEPADETDVAFASRIPSSLTDFELPFDRITEVFHNVVCPLDDDAAYRAICNATLVGPFIAGVREFPPVYVCPHTPTEEGATNTGKTSLAKALSWVFAPGLQSVGSVRIGNDGAPSARVVLALIERHGTVAIDEFLLPKDPDHPLAESKILNLATGDAVSFGKTMSNDANTVRLSAPLFISSKVVRGKADMFNRSIRVELGPLTDTMDHTTYEKVTDGSWSTLTALHARAAALLYAGVVTMAKSQLAYPPEHWRFHSLRALAVLLLARAENVALDVATARVDAAHKEMSVRHHAMLVKAMDTGLSLNAAESGSAMFTFDHLFGEDLMSDDIFMAASALGERPIKDFLRLAADQMGMSASRMVAENYGDDFSGSERQLTISLTRSLMKAVTAGPAKLAGHRGLDGWHITCANPSDIRPKFALERLIKGMSTPALQSTPVFVDIAPLAPFPKGTP